MSRIRVTNWNSENILENINSNTKKSLIALGRQIEKDAKALCPVRTGRLRASISTNWSGRGKGRATGTGYISEKLSFYGTPVKFTSRKGREGDGIGEPSTTQGKITVVVGSNVDYAPYVEFLGKAFLRPALHKNIFFISSNMKIDLFTRFKGE